MKKFKKSQKGQGLVEYLILVALIAIGTLGVIKVVGQNVAKQYENINRALGAEKTTPLKIENAAESSVQRKDLSDFMKGSRNE